MSGMLLGLPHLEMSGWGGICRPNTKLDDGEKLLLSVANRTVRWCTGQFGVPCPVRLAVGSDTAGDRWRAGFSHRTVRT
jgi:hypothetical protein